MLIFVVKALLAPLFVVSASLAARRFGPSVGGIVGGLPVVAGPILLAYALLHGRTFAAHAASGTLLGLISLTCFAVIYGRMCPRASWLVSMLVGWLGFGLATVLLDGVSSPRVITLGVVVGCFGLGILALKELTPHFADALPPPTWDLPLRAGAAFVLVFALTTVSGWLGPQLSGLLAPFPVITTVLATFTHSQRGASDTVHLLRGMLLGFGAYALFCFSLSVTLTSLPVAGAFALATGIALITQSLLLGRRLLVGARRPQIPVRQQG